MSQPMTTPVIYRKACGAGASRARAAPALVYAGSISTSGPVAMDGPMRLTAGRDILTNLAPTADTRAVSQTRGYGAVLFVLSVLLPAPGGAQQGGAGALGGVSGPARPAGPPRLAPRSAEGRVLLGGATVNEKGVWLPGPGITGVPIRPVADLPIQPWARALFEDRQVNEFEPHTRCKPSGVARQFQTPRQGHQGSDDPHPRPDGHLDLERNRHHRPHPRRRHGRRQPGSGILGRHRHRRRLPPA
jgi:hypothetical protein